MRKDIPKIYVNNIGKIQNNKEVYYSYKDSKEIIEYNKVDLYNIQKKIDELFRSNDFIYKKKIHIKTKYDDKDYIIISKSYDYLLTIDGKKVYIDNIIDIY
jgi:hypothetical protein